MNNVHVLLLFGIYISKNIEKLSRGDVWSSDTTQMFFEDVTISKIFLIGKEEMIFKYQMVISERNMFITALVSIRTKNCHEYSWLYEKITHFEFT